LLTNNTLVYCHNMLTDKENVLSNTKQRVQTMIISATGSTIFLVLILWLVSGTPFHPVYFFGSLLGVSIVLYVIARHMIARIIDTRAERIRENRKSIETDWLGYKMAGHTVYENCTIIDCVEEAKYGVILHKLTLRCDTHTDLLVVYSYPSDMLVYVEKYKHKYLLDSVVVHQDMLEDYNENMANRKLRHNQTTLLDFRRNRHR